MSEFDEKKIEYQNYLDLAQRSHSSVAETAVISLARKNGLRKGPVLADIISFWSKGVYRGLGHFAPNDLKDFAVKLDNYNAEDWIKIEKRLMRYQNEASGNATQAIIEAQLGEVKEDGSQPTGIVYDSYRVAAQLSYGRSRLGISLEEPDFFKLVDNNVTSSAAISAVEILNFEKLGLDNYLFPNLRSFDPDSFLYFEKMLPHTHPLVKRNNRDISRRKLLTYFGALGCLGLAIGAGKYGYDQDNDHSLINERMAKDAKLIATRNEINQLKGNKLYLEGRLGAATTPDQVRETQVQISQLENQIDAMLKADSEYRRAEYGSRNELASSFGGYTTSLASIIGSAVLAIKARNMRVR